MCRCTVAWQVRSWSVFFSFFLLLSIKHAFELPESSTVATSEVNGSVVADCVTFHRFVNIVIGDTSDVSEHRKIGRVVTPEKN